MRFSKSSVNASKNLSGYPCAVRSRGRALPGAVFCRCSISWIARRSRPVGRPLIQRVSAIRNVLDVGIMSGRQCALYLRNDQVRELVDFGRVKKLSFDVLEHTYDPWKTMLTLRNLISERAQLVVSLPNVRNVPLIQDLISGYWRYRRTGLLDITHIRFFTYSDMCRMF
jgi:hypothetical protein